MLSHRTDAVAVSLALLCAVHCLAFPMLASLLPLIGVVSESEWIHKVFVALALPASVISLVLTRSRSTGVIFSIFAIAGFAFLFLAFAESMEQHEVMLTVCGSILLAGAHIYRWKRHAVAF